MALAGAEEGRCSVRPTAKQITDAVADLGMLQYFPSDPATRRAIMRELAAMVGTEDELRWLVSAMKRIGVWEGPAEMRGVFCARFAPRDGVEAACGRKSAAGAEFSPDALEAKSAREHEVLKRLGAGESRALLPTVPVIVPEVVPEIDARLMEISERCRERAAGAKPKERTAAQVNRLLREC